MHEGTKEMALYVTVTAISSYFSPSSLYATFLAPYKVCLQPNPARMHALASPKHKWHRRQAPIAMPKETEGLKKSMETTMVWKMMTKTAPQVGLQLLMGSCSGFSINVLS